ncbi:laccase domain-containing protein, partial [Acetobacter estunensis]|uniref:laccase domain-containing protein n=1 Tax=Acetobacter estunensis TaxID=104097 RepID=UPI001C2D7A45|nr:polyphenol oxidase family protein [Acetobacter estunensis]
MRCDDAKRYVVPRRHHGVRGSTFTRIGGVSEGPYASLNCSTKSGDDPVHITENRRRVAGFFGLG